MAYNASLILIWRPDTYSTQLYALSPQWAEILQLLWLYAPWKPNWIWGSSKRQGRPFLTGDYFFIWGQDIYPGAKDWGIVHPAWGWGLCVIKFELFYGFGWKCSVFLQWSIIHIGFGMAMKGKPQCVFYSVLSFLFVCCLEKGLKNSESKKGKVYFIMSWF